MRKTRELLEPLSKENPKLAPKELLFCCPECGDSVLSLAMTGVRLTRDVNRVHEDGRVELGEPISDDDDPDDVFYECAACEYRLRDDSGDSVGTDHDLVQWLQEHSKKRVHESQ